MKTVIIALGGNAILRKGQSASISTQERNTREALKELLPIIKQNKTIITHGNGPQIGKLLLENEKAQNPSSRTPLDYLDAQTEGMIGYLLQQNLQNQLAKNKIHKHVATILTQTLVKENDEAFSNPSKFVGKHYTKKQARTLKKKYKIKEDFPRGWRRVVPSPKPLQIIESETIKTLLKHNTIIIAAGGGGIPVIQKNNKLDGVEAVVDKDLATACLANSVSAHELVLITDVDAAYENYGTKNQKVIRKTNLKEIKKYQELGNFHKGSMRPKISAAINFLAAHGEKVIITNIKNLKKALSGKAGTTITK